MVHPVFLSPIRSRTNLIFPDIVWVSMSLDSFKLLMASSQSSRRTLIIANVSDLFDL